jgi:hypothetical protein
MSIIDRVVVVVVVAGFELEANVSGSQNCCFFLSRPCFAFLGCGVGTWFGHQA